MARLIPRSLSKAVLTGIAMVLTRTVALAQEIPPPPAPQLAQAEESNSDSGQTAVRRAAQLWDDMPLGQLKASIQYTPPESEPFTESERLRLDQAAPLLARYGSHPVPLGESRPWMLSSVEWEAPATRHLPLLFEEPNLERQGYLFSYRCGDQTGHVGECLQPFVSAAHFFGRVPLIPYMCGLDDPWVPVYTLGVDRPGSPLPYRRHYLPLDLKAALYEAGAVVGCLYIFP